MTEKPTRHRTLPRSLAALLAAATAVTVTACTPNVTERDLRPATLAQLSKAARTPEQPAPRGTIIIDARTPSAFAKGHIPGATNLNIADINPDARRRSDLTQAEQIIVYGKDPGDSLATGLALRLLESGYDNTRLFRGGIDEWTASGGTLVTDTP